MLDYTNEVILRGTIVSFNSTRQGTTVTIVARNGDVKNYPPVKFTPNIDLSEFKVADQVVIFGYAQNHSVQRSGGRKGSHTVVIGEEMYKAKRLLFDYFPDEDMPEKGGFADDRNEVKFVGDVVSVYAPADKKDFAIVKAECKSEQHKGQCDMSCFAVISSIAKTLKPGDKVAMVGFVSTKSENVNGNVINLSNVVCKDICKLG